MISRQGSQLNRLRDADALVISFRQVGQCGFMWRSVKEVSVSARRGKRMVEVRRVEPAIVGQRAIGAFEAGKEVVEVWMRAPRNTASALRLTFHEGELHGITGEDEGGCSMQPSPVVRRRGCELQSPHSVRTTTPLQSRSGSSS